MSCIIAIELTGSAENISLFAVRGAIATGSKNFTVTVITRGAK
jgi:hypothetical protein